MKNFTALLRRFRGDRHGATAVVFGIAVIPLLLGIGAAIDYSRAASIRTSLQAATDGSVLVAARTYQKSGAYDKKAAEAALRASFKGQNANSLAITVAQSTTEIKVRATAVVPLSVMGIFMKQGVTIAAEAAVPIGTAYLEVALVLDNTGSMGQLGKMDALKAAAKDFLDIIDTSAGALDNYSIAVVPFNTQVKIDTSNRWASWMRFNPWDPDPILQVSQFSWDGCVSDRDQPFDQRVTTPTNNPTSFPAANCQYGNLQKVLPLSRDLTAIRASIDAMTPDGNTNTPVGLAWGYNVLTKTMPLGTSARTLSTANQKVIIMLTDGLNTENRGKSPSSAIDDSFQKLCTAIKDTKVRIYTVRVIEGNEAMLRDCATTPSNYYNVQNASELRPVFRSLAQELMRLRLSS